MEDNVIFQAGAKSNMTYLFLLLSFLLGGCITAYPAPNGTISDCAQLVEDNYFNKRKDRYSQAELDAIETIPDLVRDFRTLPPKKPIIIRYSDGGELVNRCDYSAALHAVRSTELADTEPVLVIVYIHGWRIDSGQREKVWYNFPDQVPSDEIQNGDAQGADLEKFDLFLEDLRARISMRSDDEPKPNVLGVFVSWKGGTKIPGVDYLSFWNRGGGADRLGRSGQLSRLFGALENITQSDDQIVYIGHSYGARILYSTVTDRLTYDVQDAYKGDIYELVERDRNLIVLINPAMEAAPYKTIDEFRFANRFSSGQPPLMLLLQSQSDWPNRTYFPLGNAIALRLSKAERQSVGHWEAFHTHALNPSESLPQLTESNTNLPPWYDSLCIEGFCLDRVDNRIAQQSPFLVVDTSSELLRGHGWFSQGSRNLHFSEWLAGFLDRHSCEIENRRNFKRLNGLRNTDNPETSDACETIARQQFSR